MLFFKRKNKRTITPPVFTSSYAAEIGKDSTSWAAIDLVCNSIANLNGGFYNKTDKQIIHDFYLSDLLEYPNIDETKFIFWYNSAKDYFHAGNIFLYIAYMESRPVSLFRLNPNSVQVKRNSFGQKIFIFNGIEYDSTQIAHIPSKYGYNGLVGKSIFNECAPIFRNTAELDDYITNSFNHSIGNRLIIDITKEYPDASADQIQQLKNQFQQNYAGIKNAGKPLVKSGKIDYTKIETDFKDNKSQQLLENRAFQEKEIAKLFGVPLALLQGTETANIENLFILFLENAIRPLATQFEQSINRLIPLQERSRIFFEYNYNNLLKTSLQTRIDTYAKQLNNGILTPNEIRRKENLPPLTETEAGNTHFIGGNLLPLRNDVINSYMASAKLKMEELNTDSPNTDGNHSNIGDDKGM